MDGEVYQRQMLRISSTEFLSADLNIALTFKTHSCLKEYLVYSAYNQTILSLILTNEVSTGQYQRHFHYLFLS